MKPRLFFRRTGHVIHTTRTPGSGLLWPMLGIGAVLILNAWGTAADEIAAEALVQGEALRVAAFEAGRAAGKQEVLLALQEGGALPAGGCASVGLVPQVRP